MPCTRVEDDFLSHRNQCLCTRSHTRFGWQGVLGQWLRVQEDLRETHHPHAGVTPPHDIAGHDIITHHHGVKSHAPHGELVVQRKFIQTLGTRLHMNRITPQSHRIELNTIELHYRHADAISHAFQGFYHG